MGVAVLLALAIGTSWAVDLEVRPGDDIRTLTTSLGPGDVVTFANGTYNIDQDLYWSSSGTVVEPIVLQAAEGAEPIINLTEGSDGNYPNQIAYLDGVEHMEIIGLTFQGSGPSADASEGDGHHGIGLNDTSYVTFKDVEVRTVTWNGFYTSGDNDHLTLDRVQVHDTENGRAFIAGCSDASCWLSDSLITNCWFHSLRGEDGAIYLYDGAQGNLIRHNVIHNVDATAIRVGSTLGGDPNVVLSNVLWDIQTRGIELRGPSITQNNILFDIAGEGIYSDDLEGELSDVIISFNTVLATSDYAVELRDWWDKDGMVLANNALCNPTGLGLYYDPPDDSDTGFLPDTSPNLLSTNVVCGLVEGEEPPDGAVSEGGGYFDFVSVEGWDFYPTTGASVVDFGDPAGETYIPDTDFNDAPREGDAPDVGAYEWIQEDNPGWQIREGFKEVGYEKDTQTETVGGCCNDEPTGQELIWVPLALLGAGWRRRRS